jgi:hypothetical protein
MILSSPTFSLFKEIEFCFNSLRASLLEAKKLVFAAKASNQSKQ